MRLFSTPKIIPNVLTHQTGTKNAPTKFAIARIIQTINNTLLVLSIFSFFKKRIKISGHNKGPPHQATPFSQSILGSEPGFIGGELNVRRSGELIIRIRRDIYKSPSPSCSII